jgi:hypothetical protein
MSFAIVNTRDIVAGDVLRMNHGSVGQNGAMSMTPYKSELVVERTVSKE